MKSIFGKALITIAVVLAIGILLCGVLAYFVTNAENGIIIDGLGRKLSLSPFFVRFFLGQERLWAGWFWFIADIIWFFGGLSCASLLGSLGAALSEKRE